ncbi:MAG: hypothetical protein NC417_08940 [Candidatus Gastranaerophilales bacterium]|nr:hypothetical protein [Candidatus Gastranaerophilales bacterium]
MKTEIAELEYAVSHLTEGDSLMGNDVIMDYRSGYPVPQSVVGFDYQKYLNLKDRYQKRIAILQKQTSEVEEFVEEIPDSLTRRIFRMKYIDKMPQAYIAKTIHMDQSSVSKKISKYLKWHKIHKIP